MTILTDLPDDMIDIIFIYLIEEWRLRDTINLVRTMKYFNKRFQDVCQNQCKTLVDNYKYYHSIKNRCDKPINAAAEVGNLTVIKWLHKAQKKSSEWAIDLAARNGYFDCVKWLHENTQIEQQYTHYAIDWAAQHGHLEIVKYLYKIGAVPTTNAMDWAAGNGHIDVVKWLDKHDTPCTKWAANSAARRGYIKIVKYLYKNRIGYFTDDVICYAAAGGYLEIVKWIYETTRETPIYSAMKWAAEYGHLEVIKYLDFIGAPCSTDVMDSAAMNGHTHILQWLDDNRNEGCTGKAVEWAAKNGHFITIKWLHDKKQREFHINNIFYIAEKHGHLNICQYLLNFMNGVSYPRMEMTFN